jgi:large subunit ribosomal protein L24
MHTRFERSKKAGQKGKQVTFSSPLSISKVQIVDPSSGKPTRVGYTRLESGGKQRVARKSGKAL